jgi:hypothetical protein
MGRLAGAGTIYLIDAVDQNDGKTPYMVSVEDVPVDAF